MIVDARSTSPKLQPAALESLLAGLLYYGSWLASAVIGIGLVLHLASAPIAGHQQAARYSMQVVTVGIALFILLPTFRVIVMLLYFLRVKEYRFGFIAGLVLLFIIAGFVIGTQLR